MIKSYGADAVRWFILSDSPPEKDVQWSNQSHKCYKFLQKIYNLNLLIIDRKESPDDLDEDFELKINSYIFRITNLIENFNLMLLLRVYMNFIIFLMNI